MRVHGAVGERVGEPVALAWHVLPGDPLESPGEPARLVGERAEPLVADLPTAELLKLYEQIRARQGGVGAGALRGDTCQGCRTSLSRVELNAMRALPPERIKRCEHCRRILVIE